MEEKGKRRTILAPGSTSSKSGTVGINYWGPSLLLFFDLKVELCVHLDNL